MITEKIQRSCGGFQGGQIDARPIAPVVFNTGQILLGLADGARLVGEEYRDSKGGDKSLATNHRRNIERARGGGLSLRRTTDRDACAIHACLIGRGRSG